MTNPILQMSAAFAGLVLLFFLALEGKTVGQSLGLIDAEQDSVLVFTIPRPEDLARVRAVIHEERVLWEGDEGFVLAGGRVYVKETGHAGELIKIGGWVDQPIKIVALGMSADDAGKGTGVAVGLTREERLAWLRKLVYKPTLSRGEQYFVLQAMNDGLEI